MKNIKIIFENEKMFSKILAMCYMGYRANGYNALHLTKNHIDYPVGWLVEDGYNEHIIVIKRDWEDNETYKKFLNILENDEN